MDHSPGTKTDLYGLSEALEKAIAKSGLSAEGLTIVARQPNVYASTFPSEIVTCRLDDRRQLRFLCKYSTEKGHESHGARGGVEYEADIYRKILNGLELSSPTYYGMYCDLSNKRNGLLLEYLADSVRILHDRNPRSVFIEAARWIGQFHASCMEHTARPELSFLHRYDHEYYRGWVRRTLHMAERTGAVPRWLEAVCSRFDEVIDVLCEEPLTIIHGEYYPKNILVQDRRIFPVDWESAAVACGEIDLATLTEGWAQDEIGPFELEYEQTRWPQGAPAGFRRRLTAARAYIQVRWLGDKRSCHPKQGNNLDALRKCAGELGLI